ncbi:MAG: hypothetical protein R3C18_15985 [Planctomycetaceae bacterium]
MPRPKPLPDAAFQLASDNQQSIKWLHGSELSEADREKKEMLRRQIQKHLDGDEQRLESVLARADGETVAKIIDNQNLAILQDAFRRDYAKSKWQLRKGFVWQDANDKANDGKGSLLSVSTRDELPFDADVYLVSMRTFRQLCQSPPTAAVCNRILQRTRKLVEQGIKTGKFEPYLACWPWQGKWMIDIAFVVPELESAIEMAQSFNQPHILHLATRQLIAV